MSSALVRNGARRWRRRRVELQDMEMVTGISLQEPRCSSIRYRLTRIGVQNSSSNGKYRALPSENVIYSAELKLKSNDI
jgi:hypothetical protein